jgi:hypothetical protein
MYNLVTCYSDMFQQSLHDIFDTQHAVRHACRHALAECIKGLMQHTN